MKLLNMYSIAALLLTTLLMSSCHNTSKQGAQSAWGLAFDSIQANRTEHLFGDTAKPACNLALNLAYVSQAKEGKLQDSLNSYLLSFSLGASYAALPPQEAAEKYTDNYITRYRSELEPMYLKDEAEHPDGEGIGSWYSYYKMVTSRIQRCEGVLLTYRSYYEEYTGGAHGMYMTSFLNIDLRSLTPVRLDDLFVEESDDELSDLLWNRLMKDKNAKTREELYDMGYASTGELTPTENFYIDEEGITFYYNVYDIAPYAMGPLTITLSRDEVSHLVNDTSLWGTGL